MLKRNLIAILVLLIAVPLVLAEDSIFDLPDEETIEGAFPYEEGATKKTRTIDSDRGTITVVTQIVLKVDYHRCIAIVQEETMVFKADGTLYQRIALYELKLPDELCMLVLEDLNRKEMMIPGEEEFILDTEEDNLGVSGIVKHPTTQPSNQGSNR